MVPGATAKRHADKHESPSGPLLSSTSISLKSHPNQKTQERSEDYSLPTRWEEEPRARRAARSLRSRWVPFCTTRRTPEPAGFTAGRGAPHSAQGDRDSKASGNGASSRAATLCHQISPQRVREPGHAAKHGPAAPTAPPGPSACTRPGTSTCAPSPGFRSEGPASRSQRCSNSLGGNLVHPAQMSVSALTHTSYLCPGLPSGLRETAPFAKYLRLSEVMLLRSLTARQNAA